MVFLKLNKGPWLNKMCFSYFRIIPRSVKHSSSSRKLQDKASIRFPFVLVYLNLNSKYSLLQQVSKKCENVLAAYLRLRLDFAP